LGDVMTGAQHFSIGVVEKNLKFFLKKEGIFSVSVE